MQEKVLGVLRHILTFAGGFVVAKGWIDESSVQEIVGALATLVGSIWSVASKK